MICYACRSPHDGEPPLCWGTGCTCQHHPEGSATPQPPQKSDEIVGYVCNVCDIALEAEEDDCDCPDGGSTLSRTAIMESELL